MLDNQLYTILKATLINGMAALGYNVDFAQANQPTQQGLNEKPTFYCTKLPGDELIGSPLYQCSWSETPIASFVGAITGTTLTVPQVTSGQLGIGQSIIGTGIPQNTFITALGTGTNGPGTYTINQTLNIPQRAMQTIGGEVTTQTQQLQSTFQINALSTQNPNNIAQLTPGDLLAYAAAILQSQATIAALQAQNVGILKIHTLRNVYFKDDRARFESSPSFDFALTHKQIIVSSVPVITNTELKLLRV